MNVLYVQGLRRFSTSNPLVLAAADKAVQTLTSRQRNAGQFTDQATMRLRCVCVSWGIFAWFYSLLSHLEQFRKSMPLYVR